MEEDERSMVITRRATLDAFWNREHSTGRVKFTMMKKLRGTAKDELGL